MAAARDQGNEGYRDPLPAYEALHSAASDLARPCRGRAGSASLEIRGEVLVDGIGTVVLQANLPPAGAPPADASSTDTPPPTGPSPIATADAASGEMKQEGQLLSFLTSAVSEVLKSSSGALQTAARG